MPRNITVTFADGTQHVYANAPDDITPDAVTARAQKDFGQPVKSLDGGRNAAPANIPAQWQKALAPTTLSPLAQKWSVLPKAKIQSAYDAARAEVFQKLGTNYSERTQRMALQKLEADPRIQAMRQLLGMPQTQTKAEAIADAARARYNDQQRVYNKGIYTAPVIGEPIKNFMKYSDSVTAGMGRGAFGLRDRLSSGLDYLTGTGNSGDSYGDQFAIDKGVSDIQAGNNPGGNILGLLVGGGLAAGGAGGAVSATGARLAASEAPTIARLGTGLQGLSTLRKGQAIRNAGKLVLGGAAAGGAQAAGEGTDPIKGAEYGAGGAAVFGGGLKAAQVLTRPFRDVLRLSRSGQILSRLTSATTDQLAERANAYRAATGAEPTLFELLPLADRNKILKQAVVGRDNVVEATSNAIRARANNLGPEMSARANEVLAPQRQNIAAGIADDLTTARGGVPAPEDPALVAGAASNPTDMVALRRQEAQAIMAPHENTPIVGNLEDLYPSVPGPSGQRVVADPEVARVISSAAGTLRARPENAGITAGDITDMMTSLRGDLAKGGIEGRTAERAINHLQDTLDTMAPEAGVASRQMTDAYAARSRMMEGMKEGAATRLRNDIQVGTSNREARRVMNAYDTPEGAQGRTLGQGNQILSSLGGSPEDALRATIGMSRGGTGRQLAQNIGPDEAQNLITAARAQDDSAQALAAASQKAGGNGGEGADAETLVSALAGLHPSSFITTKAGALRKLVDMTYIPENRARTIVDMIFSQNPDMVRRALNAVGNEPNGAAFSKYLAGVTGVLSGQAAAAPTNPPVDLSAEPETSAETAVEPSEEASAQDTAAPAQPVAEADSPYASNLQQIYDTESPEMLDLISRVSGQESRGNQFDANGQPLTSSAGAIGAMQVMPATAPEAARLAGVPFDDNAYRNDPAYNKLIGIAYLSELLRKYDGDVARAVAAYNAGPGRVDAVSNTDDWLSRLPAETQDYVRKVA